MMTEKNPTIVERFILFHERNSETVKIVSYGIASVSLIVALKQIRPFAKFRKPSSVPSNFLRKRIPLHGTVMRIEPSYGVLLMIDHRPLIPLPLFNNSKYLPVKVAGVNVTANGISWMQTIINGKNVTLIPLSKEKEYLSCIVTVQQNQENIKIGEELVKLGLATVHQDLSKSVKDEKTSAYYKCLLKAEQWARWKRNGYWHFTIYPTILWRVQQSLNGKIKSILPTFIVQRLNI